LGKLGGIRQWIESINDSLKGQLPLEDTADTFHKAAGLESANGYSP
jgi:hypothetical protein